MTDEELDRIEQVLNEATPGPWKCWKKPTELDPSVVIATDVEEKRRITLGDIVAAGRVGKERGGAIGQRYGSGIL